MLQARSEQPAAGASMWAPGMSPREVDYAGSARAREIARRREEMLGMLHDLPESEYELSLTDLVEKSAAPPPLSETKQASPLAPGRSASGRQQQTAARAERKGSGRQRGSNFRSSSDGVLLNFYMPRSISRSFTAPRSVSGGRSASVPDHDCNTREGDGDSVKCWPLPWDRRWRKSSRRELAAPLDSPRSVGRDPESGRALCFPSKSLKPCRYSCSFCVFC